MSINIQKSKKLIIIISKPAFFQKKFLPLNTFEFNPAVPHSTVDPSGASIFFVPFYFFPTGILSGVMSPRLRRMSSELNITLFDELETV